MSDSLPPSATEAAALAGLISRSRAADGSPPFSDGSLVELAQGQRRLLWLDGVPGRAAALVSATEAEFVVDPDARGAGLGTRLLEQLLREPGGEVLFWAHGDHPASRALAASHGLEPVRTLLQLAAAVPETAAVCETAAVREAAEAETAAGTEPVGRGDPLAGLTAFRPGRDEPAWLELNARVFAGHPEQGSVTRADLDELFAQPWFQAEDLLLLRERGSGELIGYCWLKVEPPEGEFYVVGVDPSRHGTGLGRRLVAAGLARLAARGIRTAHLYVEADNTAAVRLYRSFGFADRSVDIQYRCAAAEPRP